MLYLPDAFAGQAELVADLFQRIAMPVVQAEPEAQDACLSRGEGAEHLLHLFMQQSLRCFLGRCRHIVIRDKAAQLIRVVLAYRPLE